MAEIKSTLDLIMEKTNHLSLKEDEKAAMKKEDLTRRVQGLVLGFLKGQKKASVLARELEALPQEQQEEAKHIGLHLFLEDLTPLEDPARILSAVELLRGDDTRSRWETVIAEANTSFEVKDGDIRTKAMDRAREDLEKRGLKGPAIVLNSQASGFCVEEREDLVAAFRKTLLDALGPTLTGS